MHNVSEAQDRSIFFSLLHYHYHILRKIQKYILAYEIVENHFIQL